MNNIEKLIKLFSVKKFIAILLSVVFSYLAVIKSIDAQTFITIFSIVISFYFGQSTARESNLHE